MINVMKLAEELEKSGFTHEQATKSVNGWVELMNQNLATRDSVRDLESKIDRSELILKSELKEMKYELKASESKLIIKLSLIHI